MAGCDFYTAKSGDTLKDIAEHFGYGDEGGGRRKAIVSAFVADNSHLGFEMSTYNNKVDTNNPKDVDLIIEGKKYWGCQKDTPLDQRLPPPEHASAATKSGRQDPTKDWLQSNYTFASSEQTLGKQIDDAYGAKAPAMRALFKKANPGIDLEQVPTEPLSLRLPPTSPVVKGRRAEVQLESSNATVIEAMLWVRTQMESQIPGIAVNQEARSEFESTTLELNGWNENDFDRLVTVASGGKSTVQVPQYLFTYGSDD